MLCLALLMAAGSLSGALLSPSKIFVIASAVALSVSVLLSFCRRLRFFIFAVALFLGAMLASKAVYKVANTDLPRDADISRIYEGVIADSPDLRDWGAYLNVELKQGKVRLSLTGQNLKIMKGDLIRFRAKFKEPREFKNPGVFSWKDYLLSQCIGREGRIVGEVEKVASGGFIVNSIEKIRARIRVSIEANLKGRERGIAEALSIGVQSGIDVGLRDAFAGSGLAHILAISGMNVGYVAALIYLVSRLIFGFFPWLTLRIPVRQLSAIVTLPSIWCYVLVAGSPISAVRAAIMLTVFLLGVLMFKKQDLITTLSVSVVAILVLMPLSILDISFELSVAAVAGIILLTSEIMNFFGDLPDRSTRKGRIIYWAVALVSVSLAAGLATVPFVAYHFKFISVLGFVANLIAVPVTGAFLSPLVALAALTSLVSQWAAAPLWFLSGIASNAFIWFAEKSFDLGSILVFRFAPSWLEVVFMYLAVVAMVFLKKIKAKKVTLVFVAAFALIDFGSRNVIPMLGRNIEITVLDVGQGDASVVKFPNGRVLLIDGGGIKGSSFDIGRNVLAPALLKMGIHRVDWVVLSHPHYDHYRGLNYILKNFSPSFVWTNGLDAPEDENGDWTIFKKDASDAGVKFVEVGYDGIAMDVQGVRLEMFRSGLSVSKNLNDSSLAVKLDYGSKTFLFMGDLSKDAEYALLDSGRNLQASFLKVGHHGSRDASSAVFLAKVRPEVAVISAGEHNRYGFPAKETLARLEQSGAKIFRTDKDGAVKIKSNGNSIGIETFVR